MSLIHEDYVSQNLHQSAELNCLPAKGGGRQNQVLRRVLRTILGRIMAHERMAKLIKYDHFKGRIGHISTYFMSSPILHHQHVSLDL